MGMARDDIATRVIEIVASQAMRSPRDLRPDWTLDDLGLDSLGLVEAIFAIEEAFDISVPFNANTPSASGFDISSLGAMVDAVTRLVTEQKG